METLNALKVTLLNNYPNPHGSQCLRIDSYINILSAPLSTTRTALLAFQQFVHQPCSCLADHFILMELEPLKPIMAHFALILTQSISLLSIFTRDQTAPKIQQHAKLVLWILLFQGFTIGFCKCLKFCWLEHF